MVKLLNSENLRVTVTETLLIIGEDKSRANMGISEWFAMN